MSIKLLSAPVNPVEPSQASEAATTLAPLAQGAIATRYGQASSVHSADAFAWSSSTRQRQAQFIHGTFVDDPQSNNAGPSGWEYLPGWAWAWSQSVASTAIAHYLSYAAGPASWPGRLVDLYA